MFVPLWLIALVALALLLLARLAFRRGSGDMIERQRRDAAAWSAPPPPSRLSPAVAPPTPEAALFTMPEIREALERGNKIEAIRLVREQTGLGLKESKDLVERYEAR